MKKLVNQSKKLGVIALASMSLVAFSACGGGSDEFKPSGEAEKKALALVKEKYPDYKILSYDLMATNWETKGEILRKCLNDENQVIIFGTQDTSGKKDSMILTSSAFVVKQGEVSEKSLMIMMNYMSCLK